MQRLTAHVRAFNPDVIAFQEVRQHTINEGGQSAVTRMVLFLFFAVLRLTLWTCAAFLLVVGL